MDRPPTADNLAYLLARANRRLASRLATAFKPLGISVDMWFALDALAETPGLPMTQIADHLSHNLPTVTKLVDRMVSDNLVYRKPHHSDRCRVLIFPTQRGLDLAHEASAIAQEIVAGLLGQLGGTGKTRSLLGLLARLGSLY